VFTILTIYNNKYSSHIFLIKERYKNHTDMHKYTFTINITLYRVDKDAEYSDDILGYSQCCYVSGRTRRLTLLPTCYSQYATLKYSVTYGIEWLSSTHWHTVGKETIVLWITAMFRIMPTGKLCQEAPDTDVEWTLILVVARSNSNGNGSFDQWWQLLDSSRWFLKWTSISAALDDGKPNGGCWAAGKKFWLSIH
jgi:hypothetical protein